MAESDSLFSTEERRTLSAVLDRLIPADEVPGAVASGGVEYVERIFRKELAPELELFREALRTLDHAAASKAGAGAGGGFAALAPEEQDAWLRQMESGALRKIAPLLSPTFFERLLNLAAEGFYADPAQGGNRSAVSWRMMGYDSRIPGRTTAEWASGKLKTTA